MTVSYSMQISNEHRLQAILRSFPPHELVSRLLSAPDRLIAMAAWACSRESGEVLLSRVPETKQNRVRQEYALIESRHYRPADMQAALQQLIEHLEGHRIGQSSSWLRPIRRSEN